jgi:multidrug efflux pump subunit AcrB
VVVCAATRIGVGPSAVRHHLGRLRDLFADELFTRTAREQRPHRSLLCKCLSANNSVFRGFEGFREGYRALLSICLRHPGTTALTFTGFSILSMCLLPLLGQNLFPSVDAGQFDLHVRVRSGTRIAETARRVDLIEKMIRQVIPPNQLSGIIDNEGLPYSGINASYNTTGTVSSADGDILVSRSPVPDQFP